MGIDKRDMLSSVIESLNNFQFVKTEDLPEIELYMDQVTTFMDSRLRTTTRNPKEDKILTKTMINNYAKNDLLPPPERKKYSKDHMLVLLFIYYLKGILNFNDIETILTPLTEKHFQKKKGYTLEDIYKEVFEAAGSQKENMIKDIEEKYDIAQQVFADAPKSEQEFLKMFSFVALLGYDVYVKKLLIEKIIDSYRGDMEKSSAKEAKAKDKTKK